MKTTEYNSSTHGARAIETADRILSEIMAFRRWPQDHETCKNGECPMCSSQHIPRILPAIKAGQQVTLVLPAFPGKSPNPEKVLSHLPDFAEQLSLQFLGHLCQRIKEFYPPGVKIIICSDGRVFSDVVGMQESHVTAYQEELHRLIEQMNLSDVSTFNLDDVYGDLSFGQMRDELMKSFGKPLEMLKHQVRNGAGTESTAEEQESLRMYRGITRFLFEDSTHSGQTKSRSAVQKEARCKAYEVIRRSNAWSDLIAEKFPAALRLSIHPQVCGSKKLGIRLVGNESWMTPWHGVAVQTLAGFVLLKRSEAESLNAELVYAADGQPSHYTLINRKIEMQGIPHGI